jgi:hypothetical protein
MGTEKLNITIAGIQSNGSGTDPTKRYHKQAVEARTKIYRSFRVKIENRHHRHNL